MPDALDAERGEARPPLPYRDGIGLELFDDLLVGQPLGGTQNDLRAKDQPLFGRPTSRPLLELAAFFGGENDGWGDTHAPTDTFPDIKASPSVTPTWVDSITLEGVGSSRGFTAS